MGETQGKKRVRTGTANSKKRVIFRLEAPEAEFVALAGDFNQWSHNATIMKKDTRGVWRAQVTLPPGRYEYRFLVDGEWHSDPTVPERVPNPFGSENSLVEI